MNNADRPAYPGAIKMSDFSGLTKRETAVLMAMQGLCSREELYADDIAEVAIAIADATLAAMENHND